MSDLELPQLPQERDKECPVCGEQYFGIEFTGEATCKEPSVPFCIEADSCGVFIVYYHAEVDSE